MVRNAGHSHNHTQVAERTQELYILPKNVYGIFLVCRCTMGLIHVKMCSRLNAI